MSEIIVSVASEDEQARRVVSAVIGEALIDAGFGTVALNNRVGESGEFGDSMTMLDAVQQTRPELFAMPVTVVTEFGDDEVEAEAVNETPAEVVVD